MSVAAGSRARPFWADVAFSGCVLASIGATLSAVDYPQSIPGAGLAAITLVMARVDWRTRVIPNAANLGAAALALCSAAMSEDIAGSVLAAVERGATLFLVFLAFRWAFRFWRGVEGMGLGDVKLAGVLGLWLDWTYIPLSVELACLSAIAYVLATKLSSGRKLDRLAKIPFGAFLAPSIWVTWFAMNVLR